MLPVAGAVRTDPASSVTCCLSSTELDMGFSLFRHAGPTPERDAARKLSDVRRAIAETDISQAAAGAPSQR